MYRTKFADTNTPLKQILHIASELWEVTKALLKRDINHAIEECVDLIESTKTLLIILGVDETRYEREKWKVRVKNYERGYYKRA